ncbi:hypothetical protein ABV409_16500, partial [Flagellimonas sp. DF-77]
MKYRIAICVVLSLCSSFAFSQVKIGDNPETLDANSLLELESTNRALVISRMGSTQMNAITPLQGALVYNTDVGCVFYYDGSQWIDLCSEENTTNVSFELNDTELVLTDSDGNSVSVTLDGVGLQTFTADPIVNFRETIIITQNGDNFNFEVGEITGENIADSTINGVDLQDNSIDSDKLAPLSVGQTELQENAVSDFQIDYAQVTLNDFTNDAGYITSAELISPEPNNVLTDNNGVFYDDSQLRNDITANNQLIADHLVDDNDLDDENELSDLQLQNDLLTLTNPAAGASGVDLSIYLDNQTAGEVNITPISGIAGNNVQSALEEIQTDINALNAGGANTDEQDLGIGAAGTLNESVEITITNGNPALVDIRDGDFDDQNEIQDAADVDIDAITGITGGTVQLALEELQTDIDGLVAGGGNTDEQDLANVLTQGNDAGGRQIENLLDPNDDQDAATKKYVDDEIAALPAGSDNQDLDNVLTQGNDAGGRQIENLLDPNDDQDAATKKYVDDEIAALPAGSDNQDLDNVLTQGNDAGGRQIENLLDPNDDQDAATKKYVDDEIAALPAGSDNQDLDNVLTQGNDAGGRQIENLLDPNDDQDAATKKYVDDEIASNGGSVEEVDNNTLEGIGTNADPFRIRPGSNGQFLSTSGGVVIWDNLPGGMGGTVEPDNLTIEGNGVAPNVLQVRDGGITAIKLNQMGALDGQVLKWDDLNSIWSPNNDLDTQYTNGAGIALTGTTFSIDDTGATTGQILASDGAGGFNWVDD